MSLGSTLGRRAFLRDSALLLSALGTERLMGSSSSLASVQLQREIPRSGERIPAVGLGTWQGFDPSRLDAASLAPLRETLRLFHEAGGRVVDSSPMYGKSERVVGDLSTELRVNDDLWIATKVWTSGERAGIRQMEQSMQELRRSKLELMQIHNLVDWRTHLETLRAWKGAGRFRYIGVTHYQTSAFDELEQVIRREHIDFVQLPYSVALREAERRLLPAARDAGVAVLVNRPFEGGTLFRSVVGTPVPDSVRAWAATWPQAFLKFILANPVITCVIPGTGNPKHLADNMQAGLGRLPNDEDKAALLRVLSLSRS